MKNLIIAIVLILLITFTSSCNTAVTPTITATTKSIPPSTYTQTTTVTVTPTATPTTVTPTPTTPVKTTIPTTTTPTLPPATVTGIIYYRDADTGFKVDAATADKAIAAAVVTTGKKALTTEASGSYSFSLTPGYQVITVNAPGYIPTKVSWEFLSGEKYIFNIGLYKAPASVTPHAGFINGIITWDAGGWLDEVYYKPGLFQPTYTMAKENAGGNLVTVSDPIFVNEASTSGVVMGTRHGNDSWWRMMNETEYTALVKDAHSKGLEFMLWLGVIEGNGSTASAYGGIVQGAARPSVAFWDSWFSEYEKYTVQYAVIAEKLGMEYINLGHDMGYANGQSHFSGGAADSLARWQKLITAIRAVYHGKLTYFGGMDIANNYYEDDDYPPGFVNLFDAIGINVQSVNSTFNPSLTELKTRITTLLNRYTTWQRPIFVMVRTPSVDGATSFETYIEPLVVVDDVANRHTMNLFQQADIYEAFYEVINARPAGAGQVMGLFTWGYNYLDNYLFVPNRADGIMAFDKSGNIRGKPAESVMKFWNFN